MTDSDGSRDGERIFDYYRNVVELGTAELTGHRNRFLEYNKINIAIGAGITLIMLIDTDERFALFFVSMMIIFGLILCASWIRQIQESLTMLAAWRAAAGKIEQSEQFRRSVGEVEVQIWSREDILVSIEKGTKIDTSSGRHHSWMAVFWLFFYVLVAVAMYLRLLAQQAA